MTCAGGSCPAALRLLRSSARCAPRSVHGGIFLIISSQRLMHPHIHRHGNRPLTHVGSLCSTAASQDCKCNSSSSFRQDVGASRVDIDPSIMLSHSLETKGTAGKRSSRLPQPRGAWLVLVYLSTLYLSEDKMAAWVLSLIANFINACCMPVLRRSPNTRSGAQRPGVQHHQPEWRVGGWSARSKNSSLLSRKQQSRLCHYEQGGHEDHHRYYHQQQQRQRQRHQQPSRLGDCTAAHPRRHTPRPPHPARLAAVGGAGGAAGAPAVPAAGCEPGSGRRRQRRAKHQRHE